MKYAISYVSTAHTDLQAQGVKDIMTETLKNNNRQKVTGILLYNERNFFQLLEGEKQTIQDIYKKITLDPRHQDIIKFLEKPVFRPPFDGYMADFITDTNKYDKVELKHYLLYIEVLNPESQKAVKKVMELMMA